MMLSKETRMRDMIDHAFAYAGFHPKVLFESISTHTVLNMVRETDCPGIFSYSLMWIRLLPWSTLP
ncbi:MAG: hypothetical protein ACLUD2_09050 [Clostridium sp.]